MENVKVMDPKKMTRAQLINLVEQERIDHSKTKHNLHMSTQERDLLSTEKRTHQNIMDQDHATIKRHEYRIVALLKALETLSTEAPRY